MRWAVQSGHSVIPKSTCPERISDNLAMALARNKIFHLSSEEMGALNAVSERVHEKLFWDGSVVL